MTKNWLLTNFEEIGDGYVLSQQQSHSLGEHASVSVVTAEEEEEEDR